ncbi:MAG: DNA (cytosine-5-)-methyltransferase [Limnothrix sp. BL-A-16]|jgi:DNA (cytosine-5)-methyltransferase 1
MIKFVDLFAGIGGMRKGLELALSKQGLKGDCVFSSEIDEKAKQTYQLNFGEEPYGDIRAADYLPTHDVLLAGFPCQSFSYAGKQKGFADTRGTLFFEIERLLSNLETKPRILLLENVRGFTTHDSGRTHKTVIERLRSLGYRTRTLLLNSSNFGVPQNRVRVYIVGILDHEPELTLQSNVGTPDSHQFKKTFSQIDLFINQSQYCCVRDILERNPDPRYQCSETFTEQLRLALNGKPLETLHGFRLIDYRGGNSIHSWDLGLKGNCSLEERDLMNAIIENRRKKHFGTHQDGKALTLEQIKTFWNQPNLEKLLQDLVSKGYLRFIDDKYNPKCGNMSFEVFKFLDPDSISITLTASDSHRLGVVQNGIPRRITPRECARLQGFPDDFQVHTDDIATYHQLGNSVSVPVIQAIFEDLFRSSTALHHSELLLISR